MTIAAGSGKAMVAPLTEWTGGSLRQSEHARLLEHPIPHMVTVRAVISDRGIFLRRPGFRCRPRCLVLDVMLPGGNGLGFHAALASADVGRPVTFISGHADIPMSVRAMKAGAVKFLTKPVRHQEALDAIYLATGPTQSSAQ